MRSYQIALCSLLIASCGGDDGGITAPATGTLEITTSTPTNPPATGYTVAVDGGAARAIGATARLTISDLSAGSHTVQLTPVEGCTVEGGNSRTVTVLAGSSVTVAFTVACQPPAPTLPRIAFSSLTRQSSGVFIVNPDGTGLQNLSSSTPLDSDPVWSPDGRRLLFRSGTSLQTMNPDGSDRTLLRLGREIISEYGWSPDGSRIGFILEYTDEEEALVEELWVMQADGGSMGMVAANAFHPTWSPDGQRIAFVSSRDDGDVEIRVINVDGTGERALTDGTLFPLVPAWSPDGGRIVFSAYTDGGIYGINPDGTGLLKLSQGQTRDEYPVWSPDGSMLAFTTAPDQQSQEFDIAVMNRDGTGRRILTSRPGIDDEPEWSPDGSQIAYTRHEPGQWEVYVMNADGTGQTNVSNRPNSYDVSPDWSSQP